MVVELAAAFPVLIVVAVVAVNALLFFSECGAFDNAFRDAVRVHATSPSYGQGIEQSRAQVGSVLSESFDEPFERVSVAVRGTEGGHVEFEGTLELSPTLFGLGLKREVFGVSLPPLSHRTVFVVDRYKPGVLA
ncbi:hypothetical protein B5F40_02000 [Gordonibacter sp. An230]|uniref:hypothetical protein n=1 Tax=Gordonibacter sp. An230 TaxID=1965592 RepID=UPI000B37809F|nr:hypothetical protein [Gordonibacter sp. An230]OUO92126.1 hypothetical protein B5F40_02000 [Gordonibacter sp. An230]